ncbi:MAG TPA: PDZ domain-containing protein [Opitutus sp.]|nr:PDZ domain-containing protein [Opitutus sp.]
MKRLLAALAALIAFAVTRPLAGAPPHAGTGDNAPVVLPGVRVDGHPWTCFGLSFAVLGNPRTRRVSHLVIWRVAENSEAAFKDIKPGDEILEADDTPVASLSLDLDQPHSRFRELFINRRPGERIRLKIGRRHSGKPFTVALTEAGPRQGLPYHGRRH